MPKPALIGIEATQAVPRCSSEGVSCVFLHRQNPGSGEVSSSAGARICFEAWTLYRQCHHVHLYFRGGYRFHAPWGWQPAQDWSCQPYLQQALPYPACWLPQSRQSRMLFKVKVCVGGSALDGRVLMWNKIKHHCHTSTSSSFSLHKKGGTCRGAESRYWCNFCKGLEREGKERNMKEKKDEEKRKKFLKNRKGKNTNKNKGKKKKEK